MVFTFLKDTVQFYRQHVAYFAAILIPIILPLEIADFLIQRFWVTDPQSLTQQIPSLMLMITIYPIYQGALILAVSQRLIGQTPSPSSLWQQGARFWFGLVAVNAMFYAAVFLGTLAFIVPGIYLAIRLVLAEQNVLLNHESPIDAIKSSWEDTSDQFWNLLLGTLILGAIVILATTLLVMLFGEIVALNSPVMLIPALMQSLLYPLFVIYYLRVRHYIQNGE